MLKDKRLLKITLDVLISVIGFGTLGTLISNRVDDILKHWAPFPHAFVYLLVLFLGLLIFLRFRFERVFSDLEAKPSSKILDAKRQVLLESLQKRYDVRIKKKMDEELGLTIQLNLVYTKEGVDDIFVNTYFVEGYEEANAGDFSSLFTHFTEKLRRLLIIGEPGSGKTLLLLNFGQRMIELAKSNSAYPIPILLNLSSWIGTEESFEIWLEQNLVHFAGQYGTNKEHAKELARSNNLILLLDGLDEVDEKHRNSCLNKLSSYLKKVEKAKDRNDRFPVAIICSRREEYLRLKIKALVQAIVSIEPLTEKEIINELTSLKRDLKVKGFGADKLLTVLQKHPQLTTMLNTAFYLHIMLKLCDEDFNVGAIDRPTQLIRIYIKHELGRIKSQFPLTQSWGTLSWLAHKISGSRTKISFELTDMQPGWVERKWIYETIRNLPLLLGILVLNKYFVIAFIFSILVINKFAPEKIESFDVRTLNLSRSNVPNLMKSLFTGIIYGLLGGILGGLVYWYIESLKNAILFSISLTIVLAAVGLYQGFFTSGSLPSASTPYKRFRATFAHDFILNFIVFFIVIYSLSYATSATKMSQINVTKFLLIASLQALNSTAMIDHLTLRFILFLNKRIPWNFVQFLDAIADKTGLMERDGGQWRFRHQLIQDYFINNKHP